MNSLLRWLSLIALGAITAQAGRYGTQNFTFPNGTVPGANNWNDGASLSSTLIGTPALPTASVWTNSLRLTRDGVPGTSAAFKIPDLDLGSDIAAFNVSFTLKMSFTGSPGSGFAVNVGEIPDGEGDGEIGYPLEHGLVVGFTTVPTGGEGSTQGEIAIYANRVKLAAYPYTFTSDLLARPVSIHWDSLGLDISYGGAAIADNLPVPGYIPHVGDTFAFTARSGFQSSQDTILDSLLINTSPALLIATGGPIISEFVAENGRSLDDDDGEASDWVEIFNGGAATSLKGWFLTNEKANLSKWALAPVNLSSNGYRIVFASGKDRSPTNGQLHANFTLSKAGGWLALVRPDLSIASEYTYGPQKQDVAYGEVGASRTRGYLETPTPGKKNITLVADGPPAEGIVFSRDGGLLTNSDPALLSINSPVTPGAVIRYTLNNSVPTAQSAIYSAPFSITNSRTIRARVFVPNRLPGKVSSRTFLKLDPTLTSFASSGVPFSSPLPVIILDSFGFDIDGTTDPGSGRPYRPAAGIVLDTDPVTGRSSLARTPDLQVRGGAHVRGESSSGFGQKSYAWEMWDDTDRDSGSPLLGMPTESDWVLHGPFSDQTLMRNYLMYSTMRDLHGDFRGSRTRFVEVFFNQRPNQPVAYADYRGVFLLVEKIKQGKNRVDIEKINPLMTDSNLITGGYVFKTDKASVGSVAWTTPGGVSIQTHDPRFISTVQSKYLQGYLADFEKTLDLPYAGDPQVGYPAWIDTSTFIDSQWWVEFAKQVDGYVFSTYYHKDRAGKMRAGPVWDFNISLGNANYATGDTPTGWLYDTTATGPLAGGLWYPKLLADPDYRVKTFDRYWELRKGVWGTQSILARIDAAAALLLDGATAPVTNNVPLAIQSPVGRQYRKYNILGDIPGGPPWPNPDVFRTLTTYQSHIAYLKNWVSQRLAWMDDQNVGGFSAIFRPPVAAPLGGSLPIGGQVTLAPYSGTAPAGKFYPDGVIYYTTDGSDPRPSGFKNPGSQDLVLVPEYQDASYFVPTASNGGSTALFSDWTSADLGPTAASLTWQNGKLGLGFDDSASPLFQHIGGGATSQGDIRAAMQGVSSTVFIRVPFVLTDVQASLVTALRLKMRTDDAFIAFINGVEVGRYNMKTATRASYTNVADALPSSWKDTNGALQRDFTINSGVGALRAGNNVLAILGINASASDDDALFSPRLSATLAVPANTAITSRPYTGPITLNASTVIRSRMFANGYWSPLSTESYVVDAEPASAANLVISEIQYNPAPAKGAEIAVSTGAGDFEYLEFMNTGLTAIDLAGVRITEGVRFDFSTAAVDTRILPPSGRVVVCSNIAAFQARYGANAAVKIAGAFQDSLSNSGEKLTVIDKNGAIIMSFTYGDKDPWPTDADGAGYSLVLNNPLRHPAPDLGNGSNWRASASAYGLPGLPDTSPLLLPPAEDLDGDGLSNLLEYAVGSDPAVKSTPLVLSGSAREFTIDGHTFLYGIFEYRQNLRAEGITYDLQTSHNLIQWSAQFSGLTYVGAHHNDDGTATMTWRTSLPIDNQVPPVLFARLAVTQQP